MKYSDKQRIEKMVETTNKLINYLMDGNITPEQVLSQEPIRWTITTPLYNIGEHAYNISNECRQTYSNVPCSKISGLRHRLVHDYDNTNWNLICTIVYDVLPEFVTSLQDVLKQMNDN